MCALYGYLDYGKRVPWKTLQKLVQALANASEVRGTHATGIAYNTGDGLKLFKRPRPAHKLHFRIPNGTAVVMGHTRFTTQGDQKYNHNNHPFRGYAGTDFALAHNGVLWNDASLRKQLHLPNTTIETDSFIMVQLIESQKALTFDSLRYAAETVRGSFTFTLLDAHDSLYIIKGDSPLYLLHFPSLGLYVYSSTKEIMNAAFCKLSVRFPGYEIIPVEEGELLRIAPNGTIARDKFTVQDDYRLFSPWFRPRLYDWDYPEQVDYPADEYLTLIELAGYYGADPEDIRELREMGYSYDEIEAFLVDPDSFDADLSLCEPV